MYLLQYNTSFSVNKCTSVSKASVYMFVFTVHSGSTNHWMWYLAIFFFYPITNKIYSFKNTLLVNSDATRNLKTKVQSNWSLMLSNKCSAVKVQYLPAKWKGRGNVNIGMEVQIPQMCTHCTWVNSYIPSLGWSTWVHLDDNTTWLYWTHISSGLLLLQMYSEVSDYFLLAQQLCSGCTSTARGLSPSTRTCGLQILLQSYACAHNVPVFITIRRSCPISLCGTLSCHRLNVDPLSRARSAPADSLSLSVSLSLTHTPNPEPRTEPPPDTQPSIPVPLYGE